MDRRTVSLQVGGQSYRVVSSASEADLQRLAAVVDAKIAELVPRNRPVPPQAVLLAAIALANQVEEEQARRGQLEARTRDLLRRVLMRIDEAVEASDEADEGAAEPLSLI